VKHWEDEPYVRVYSRKDIDWKLLGWEGRTVHWHLRCEATGAGAIELGDGDEAEAVAVLTELPLEVVRIGLQRLASRGVTERHGTSLLITDFLESETAKRSDRVRAQVYRDRVRMGDKPSVTKRDDKPKPVTRRDDPSRPVTENHGRHESSLLSPALPCLALPDQILAAAADPRPVSLPRATAPSAAAAAAADRVLDSLGEEDREPEPLTQTQVRERLPGNLAEALRVPICVRAELVTSGRVAAQWVEPQKWPEVYELEQELAKAEGRKPLPLGSYDRDGAVRTVVELYAAGYLPGTLRDVVRKLPSEPFWNQPGKRRDLSNLSAVVVRKVVTGDAGDNAGRDLLARVDADLAKGKRTQPDEGGTQLGSLLGAIGGAR
jgi:hypothetical protein